MDQQNELDPRLLGLMAINFAPGTITSARQQMVGSQIAQVIDCDGVTEKAIFTGIEFELGKTTFNIQAPCDMEILKVFDLYRRSMGHDAIELNPLKVVMYRDLNTGKVGCLELMEYASYHQTFGFKYRFTKFAERIKEKAVFEKGTVFADSPAVTEDGFFCYGAELETVYLGTHSSGEDGLTFSRSALESMTYRTYIKRTIQWGKSTYPINKYGTLDVMKAFPDIGEYVDESGILMVLRDHSPELDIVGLNKYDLMEVDYFYDNIVYAAGPGGRVIDIRVWYDDRSQHNATPRGMEEQAMKYLKAKREFNRDMLSKYHEMKARNNGVDPELTPRMHQLMIDALREIEPGPNAVENTDATDKVDVWRLEFTIEYVNTPSIRSKFTNTAGGKGVAVKVVEDEDMPVDDFGNRAQVIASVESTINRNNTQQWYEQAINAYGRGLIHHMRRLLDLPIHETPAGIEIILGRQSEEKIQQLLDLLERHYKIISRRMHEQFVSMSRQIKLARLSSILTSKLIPLLKPSNDEEELTTIVLTLREVYRAEGIEERSCVTYKTYAGVHERTVTPALIGSEYWMQLEKTGDSWAAVASPDFQHHGVPATISKLNRYSHPHRNQPTRAIGEAEGQLISAHAHPLALAEWIDRNNSPESHRALVRSIYATKTPSNIPMAVDRKKIPLGGPKPMRLVKHLMECAGMRFVYKVSERTKAYYRLIAKQKESE